MYGVSAPVGCILPVGTKMELKLNAASEIDDITDYYLALFTFDGIDTEYKMHKFHSVSEAIIPRKIKGISNGFFTTDSNNPIIFELAETVTLRPNERIFVFFGAITPSDAVVDKPMLFKNDSVYIPLPDNDADYYIHEHYYGYQYNTSTNDVMIPDVGINPGTKIAFKPGVSTSVYDGHALFNRTWISTNYHVNCIRYGSDSTTFDSNIYCAVVPRDLHLDICD